MTSRFMQIFSLKTSLDKQSAIMSLYGRMRVSENLYSRVFAKPALQFSLGKLIDSHSFKMSCLTCLVFYYSLYCFF